MNINKNIQFVCFGEVLLDVFPDHTLIGGAPLNVAYRLAFLGFPVSMISAVGTDLSGHQILDFLSSNHIDITAVNRLKKYATGTVHVTLDAQRNASYTIKHPVAWDAIPYTQTMESIANHSQVFIYGSLVARDEISFETLSKLLKVSKGLNVFDVNIRKPFDDVEKIKALVVAADILKCNEEELAMLTNSYQIEYATLEESIALLHKATAVPTICVTLGANGAILYTENCFYKNNGYTVKVKDTVGAGDAFLAVLVSQLVTHMQPQLALDYACAMGAMVAATQGATADITTELVTDLVTANT